jgi:hypothetical protein
MRTCRCGQSIEGKRRDALYCSTRCNKATQRQRSGDHMRAYARAYYAATRDRQRQKSRESYLRHRKQRIAQSRQYAVANPKRVRGWAKASYIRNREQILARRRQLYAKNPTIRGTQQKRRMQRILDKARKYDLLMGHAP